MSMTLQEAWPRPQAAHVRQAVGKLTAHFDPLRIMVFGSYARGEAGAGNDLDLLIVLPKIDDKRELAIAMRRVLSDLQVPHDVHVTTPDEIERRGWIIGSLLREALREGQVVYERSEQAKTR